MYKRNLIPSVKFSNGLFEISRWLKYYGFEMNVKRIMRNIGHVFTFRIYLYFAYRIFWRNTRADIDVVIGKIGNIL